MIYIKKREEALELRKTGMSYSQIKKILHVSKSSLSYWLRQYPLSKERISELRDKNEVRIERYRETMRKKKEKRLKKVYKNQKKIILPINKRELFLAGLFLYWGEGTKSHEASAKISNTDPAMIKFFIKWLTICWNIKKEKVRVYLQLYADMNIENEINYWSRELNLPRTQFGKSYIKATQSTKINHKGGFGHGTCGLAVGGARFSETVMMSLKVISDKYKDMRP